MKISNLPLLAVLFVCSTTPFTLKVEASALSEVVREEHFSLKKGLALGGYDPVAYFQEGPTKGRKTIHTTYKGVVYRFSSEANLKTFEANPLEYEAQYGGWCAWAMIDGGRTKPNPESYKIVDGKLYLFYDGLFGDTLAMWNEKLANESEDQLIADADEHWLGQVAP
ncbi:MAG: YHS domain-containing (seleno)protein [Verrucomicrobiota bacterium]